MIKTMKNINKKIKMQSFISKEIIEGTIISIRKIDFEKIIRIKTNNFEFSISESILNNSYKVI